MAIDRCSIADLGSPFFLGTKAKPAARTADGRAAGRAERGAAKREDPRLRNRKDRETFGFDVSSPLEPATLEGLSAASARDPEEVRRFAAVSNESFDAAPEPFALAADGAPDAVLLSDMLLMERKLATTAAEPSAAAGEDSRFGRWFEARESPPVRASSLLAAVAPTPPPTEPAAKPHVDAAVVSFSAASVTSVYAAAPPSSASVSVPASAPSAPVSSASDQRTQRAAPVAAPSQPTAAPSLPPSSSSSAPASAAPSVAPTTAPAPAPAAQHASHSAPTNSNSGFPAPSHSHEHHAPPPHASHYEPSSPSSFPLPQMPRPPTADGSSFPLPQLSAMPPSTFTSNALLSLLRQGEQQRGPAPPMAKGGAAPPPQKSGEAPMAYHPSYGMHPSHMQMMPPPYAAQPPPMHAGQMQSAPPHLGHPHSHLGPRPPTHTPLPPPAGYAPPNYPPASKGAAAGAPPPGMMKGPAPYMAPPYANAPPPGKMPPGYGPEAGYYYGPPQQAAPQQGGPRQPFPQGPPQPHGAPPPAGAGLERWFGQMAVAAPPRPTGPVQMKSLDEIESQVRLPSVCVCVCAFAFAFASRLCADDADLSQLSRQQ